ncbi:MAG: hypothetical protein QME45_08430 [Clostridiales bacterium]|nr:hypothetical protein [Clostridiales bacterium]HBM81157.1 hypothetical protein [Clostridiaceae bacterium]
MSIYTLRLGKYKGIANKYSKKGEVPMVSNPVIFNGNKYYQIVYRRSFLMFPLKKIQGMIFIDEQGEYIEDDDTLKSLARLFYYYSFFLNNKRFNINNLIKNGAQMESEKRYYEDASSVLGILIEKSVEGADKVKKIVDTIPHMRKKANDVLLQFKKIISGYENGSSLFCQDALDSLFPLYVQSAVMSFERVKYINGCSLYYGSIRNEIVKLRKNIKNALNKSLKDNIEKLQYITSFFINVVNYYNKLIDYTPQEYENYFIGKSDEYISGYVKNIRRY